MGFRSKEYAGLIQDLEFLPSAEQLEEITAKQQCLTRPEISSGTFYVKKYLKQVLVNADYSDDGYLEKYLHDAFPASLVKSIEKKS